jgi:hypothetical protein
MNGKQERSPSGKGLSAEQRLHKALSHPLRVQILQVLHREKASSPNRYRRASGVDLNLVAYHFRVLRDFELIEVVETIPKRGATEHIYSLAPDSPVLSVLAASTRLAQNGDDPRTAFLRRVLAEERVEESEEGVKILPVEVDARGREEVDQILADLSGKIEEVVARCKERLLESKEEPTTLQIGIATLP